MADVVAPHLYGGLVGWEHLPARFRDDMRRFQWDFSTVKVDWALSSPVPWTAPDAALAGTVHLSASMDEMTAYCSQIAMGQVPSVPFVLAGQMTTADAHRSPPGTESLWGYTHVPRQVRGDPGEEGISGAWNARELEAVAGRIERQIERFAPGFADRIVNRHIMGPGPARRAQLQPRRGCHQRGYHRHPPTVGLPAHPRTWAARDSSNGPVFGLVIRSSGWRGPWGLRRKCRPCRHPSRAQKPSAPRIRLGFSSRTVAYRHEALIDRQTGTISRPRWWRVESGRFIARS